MSAGTGRAAPAAPDPPLSDGTVTLRPPSERDLSAIEAGIRDPDVVRWIGPPEGTAAEVLALNRSRWQAGAPTFAICDADDRCLGHVWVNRGTKDPAIGFIGYWLLPTERDRGLATRAVRLLATWAMAAMDLHELRLVTEPGNLRSQAVAERSGFVRVDGPPGRAEIDGRAQDSVVFVYPFGPAISPPTS